MTSPSDGCYGKSVTLTYTNWQGETAERTFTPTGVLVYASNGYHPGEQWLLEALDHRPDGSRALRLFALTGFWARTPDQVASFPCEAPDELAELNRRATQGLAEFKVVPHPIPESGDADLPGALYFGGIEVATIYEKYGPGVVPRYEADGALLAALINAYRSGQLVPSAQAQAARPLSIAADCLRLADDALSKRGKAALSHGSGSDDQEDLYAEAVEAEGILFAAIRTIAAQTTARAEMLREVVDKGLIYWEPQTGRGATAKADMIARCEALLSDTTAAPPSTGSAPDHTGREGDAPCV